MLLSTLEAFPESSFRWTHCSMSTVQWTVCPARFVINSSLGNGHMPILRNTENLLRPRTPKFASFSVKFPSKFGCLKTCLKSLNLKLKFTLKQKRILETTGLEAGFEMTTNAGSRISLGYSCFQLPFVKLPRSPIATATHNLWATKPPDANGRWRAMLNRSQVFLSNFDCYLII